MGASALMLSVSVTIVAHYFGAKASLWLAVAIWPCVILLLHSGYWVVVSKLSNKRTDGTHDEI